MSWHIKAVGSRAAVKAKILADPHVPQGIKDTVVTICDESKAIHLPNGVKIETWGHVGDDSWNNAMLHIEPVEILSESTTEPAPAGEVTQTGVTQFQG